MLERLQEQDDVAVVDTDTLGGYSPLNSALYDMTIKYAYYTESRGGALTLNLDMTSSEGESMRKAIYLTSGKSKGGLNYRIGKDGRKIYNQGFVLGNSIALLTTKKKIGSIPTEKKTIMLYSYDARKEVPTEVEMLTEMIGCKVTMGIIKQTVDKKALNQTTDVWEPTGETKEENDIDKVFRASDGKTVAEILAKAEVAEFKDRWVKKWTGVVKDLSTGTGAVAGVPAATIANAAVGAAAPVEELFNE